MTLVRTSTTLATLAQGFSSSIEARRKTASGTAVLAFLIPRSSSARTRLTTPISAVS